MVNGEASNGSIEPWQVQNVTETTDRLYQDLIAKYSAGKLQVVIRTSRPFPIKMVVEESSSQPMFLIKSAHNTLISTLGGLRQVFLAKNGKNWGDNSPFFEAFLVRFLVYRRSTGVTSQSANTHALLCDQQLSRTALANWKHNIF